jgi:putative membrane protein insertion efficiency factor
VTSRVLIGIYQRWITPANGPTCNFIPTCSAYTLSAIERYGFWGILMGAERILRDHSRIELYPLKVFQGRLKPYDPPSAHAPFPLNQPRPFHLIPR